MVIQYSKAGAVKPSRPKKSKEQIKASLEGFVPTKTEVVRLRVSAELAADFFDACKQNDTTPSAALRQFMREYI